MSVAQLLDHLQHGDVIIVRGSAFAARFDRQGGLRAAVDVDADQAGSFDLLHNLIAARGGGKK